MTLIHIPVHLMIMEHDRSHSYWFNAEMPNCFIIIFGVKQTAILVPDSSVAAAGKREKIVTVEEIELLQSHDHQQKEPEKVPGQEEVEEKYTSYHSHEKTVAECFSCYR